MAEGRNAEGGNHEAEHQRVSSVSAAAMDDYAAQLVCGLGVRATFLSGAQVCAALLVEPTAQLPASLMIARWYLPTRDFGCPLSSSSEHGARRPPASPDFSVFGCV